MALLINIRHLDRDNVELAGKLPVADLDLADVDEMIQLKQPLEYELEAQKLDASVLVQGSLMLPLNCECVRCLKAFVYRVDLPDWACLLPLEGDEKVVVTNDCIDLTPYVREDILLGFPQHPLCKPDCSGLPKKTVGKTKQSGGTGKSQTSESSAWAELNKLKI